MKELYIAPVLDIVCFAPMERLANQNEEIKTTLLMDISTYDNKSSGVDVEDEDFGLDI